MIIAKLSVRRTLLYTTGVLAGAVLCSIILLHHPDGVPLEEYANSKHLFGYETVLVGLIACAVLAVEQLITLGRLASSASAIWTSDEKIVFINPYWWPLWRKSFLCSAAKTITRRSEGWYTKRGITVQLDDGRELFIATWMCAERPATNRPLGRRTT